MTENEEKLLVALALMVNQYLDRHGDEVDSRSISAGEYAIEGLANFGLMEVVNTRFGRWTEVGRKFCREKAGIRDPAPADRSSGIVLVTKSESKE